MPTNARSGDRDPAAGTAPMQARTEWQPGLLVVLLVWVVVLIWTVHHQLAVWRSSPRTRPGPSIDELEHEVLDGFLFHDDCRWCRLELAYESTPTQQPAAPATV